MFVPSDFLIQGGIHGILGAFNTLNVWTICAIWVSYGIHSACILRTVTHSHETDMSGACPTLTRCVLLHCLVFFLSIDLLVHMDFNTCRPDVCLSHGHTSTSPPLASHLPWTPSFSSRFSGGSKRYHLHTLLHSCKHSSFRCWLNRHMISMAVCFVGVGQSMCRGRATLEVQARADIAAVCYCNIS